MKRCPSHLHLWEDPVKIDYDSQITIRCHRCNDAYKFNLEEAKSNGFDARTFPAFFLRQCGGQFLCKLSKVEKLENFSELLDCLKPGETFIDRYGVHHKNKYSFEMGRSYEPISEDEAVSLSDEAYEKINIALKHKLKPKKKECTCEGINHKPTCIKGKQLKAALNE